MYNHTHIPVDAHTSLHMYIPFSPFIQIIHTHNKEEGLSVLNQAMAVIKEKIEEKRGVFNVQMEVRSILGFLPCY